MSVSIATQRKIDIIIEKLGNNWKDQYPNKSVNFVYNTLINDSRKNLYCKISSDSRKKLDTLLNEYDAKLTDFLETLITKEYYEYEKKKAEHTARLAKQFST